MADAQEPKPKIPWRERVHEVIFEADTTTGLAFDIILLVMIVISVIGICLETVSGFGTQYKPYLDTIEIIVTVIFTVEYVLRLLCVRSPSRYIFSFFGIVDLLSVLPLYIGIFYYLASEPSNFELTTSFGIVRSLRLLRAFRLFKLGWLTSEAEELLNALWQSRAKVVVFLTTVLIAVTIAGAIMYELEGRNDDSSDFTSIPKSIYWAIVTMTTVGYGDLSPKTPWGQFVASVLILLGYSLIIVPTGFVTAEFVSSRKSTITTRSCSSCLLEGHDADAVFCKYCGAEF